LEQLIRTRFGVDVNWNYFFNLVTKRLLGLHKNNKMDQKEELYDGIDSRNVDATFQLISWNPEDQNFSYDLALVSPAQKALKVHFVFQEKDEFNNHKLLFDVLLAAIEKDPGVVLESKRTPQLVQSGRVVKPEFKELEEVVQKHNEERNNKYEEALSILTSIGAEGLSEVHLTDFRMPDKCFKRVDTYDLGRIKLFCHQGTKLAKHLIENYKEEKVIQDLLVK